MTSSAKPLIALAEANDLLRSYHLRAQALSLLERGTINSNYRVTTAAGPLFLRVAEGKREAEVRFEADLIWHLNTRGFPTPALLRTRRSEAYLRHPASGKFVMLMQWVAGDEISEDEIGEDEARSVGALLGRFHQAAASFPEQRAGTYTLAHIAARVQRLRQEPRIPDGIVEHLEREAARLLAARRGDLPAGLGHGDLFPDNLLFARSTRRPRQAGWILDLEQAATVPYLYDVAVALLSFCSPAAVRSGEPARLGPLRRAAARALWQGYASAFPPGLPVDRGALAPALYQELRWAALRFTVTRLTDVHLPRLLSKEPRPPAAGHDGAPRHSKDYRDFLRRLELLTELAPAALAELWAP